MNPNLIKRISSFSKIEEIQFPLDVRYLSERLGAYDPEINEDIQLIKVVDINYIGQEKSTSVSPISLCFDPNQIINSNEQ